MVQRKIEKTSCLFFAGVIIIMAFIPIPDIGSVSLHRECSVAARFLYPLFHASFLHAFLNAWCLLSIVFIYSVSWQNITVAWIISALAPSFILSDTPTIGMSAVCFALLGMIVFKVARRRYYLSYLAPYLALGFLFPSINGALHLFAFLAGAFVGVLNAPIPCSRK